MSGIAIFFYRGGVFTATSGAATEQLVARLESAIVSGEASGFVIEVAKKGAVPVIETYNDVKLTTELMNAAKSADWNTYAKKTFAAVAGLAAGLAVIPFVGPLGAIYVDQKVSEWYENSYDAASNWSAQQDWSALFDFIDQLADTWRTATELGFNDVSPGPDIGIPRNRRVDPRCNVQFQSSTTFIQRVDPLTLDLDADGLETTGINPTNPILFDHDADGVRTATGWVKPDDAFLVFDRNNNGLIDTGRELFGDSTQLYAGGLAADGFAALAQEDTNADGLVNAADANWTKLKLWRDLNQDGISQTNELLTLASQNITALKVAKTANSQTLANGNQIADLGGFIRGDGSEGTLGEVTGSMGDINLADNPFYSQFTDSIPLTEAARGIADMQGSGRVRSLRQAASLDGNTLVTQVNALAGQSRAQMLQSLDTLLSDWSATSDFVTSGAAAQGYGYSLKYLPAGTGTADALAAYGLNGTDPASLPAAERNRLAGIRQQIDTLNSRLAILERFNGSAFVTVGEGGIVTGGQTANDREWRNVA